MSTDEMSLNPFTDVPYSYFSLVYQYRLGRFNFYYFKVWFAIVMFPGSPSGPWSQIR